jgi:predicted MFS family arabinose efflux permease
VSNASLAHPVASTRRWARGGVDRLADEIGGPARLQVIAILAAVLALNGADLGTVSATADDLKRAFGINNTDIGLLVTASTLIGAIFTIPVGALTDRVRRTRLLALSIAMWAVATFFSGAAESYVWLIMSRIGLGAVTATAGPTIASLTGDFFPAKARARMYGFILAGELLGTGFGFVGSGYLSAILSWRYAFWWLIIPSAVLTYVVWRLPEPARGGQSRLSEGQEELVDADDVEDMPPKNQRREEEAAIAEAREGVVEQVVEQNHTEPYRNQILTKDPAKKNLWWAVRYVLRVRTDVVIIIASALGYFYFSGLRTFAIIFAQDHYGISKSLASTLVIVIGLGALAGVYAGGRVSDKLMARGVVNARVIVPAVVMLTISVFLAPAFLLTQLWIAIPLLTIGAGLLGAANPPQDAARLDIIHPHLWGRSEGIRSALRGVLDAAAPVTFGLVSDRLFGGNVTFGGNRAGGDHSEALGYTFLLFLVVVIAAGLIVLIALRTYPRDVATADASVANTLGDRRGDRRRSRRGEGAGEPYAEEPGAEAGEPARSAGREPVGEP